MILDRCGILGLIRGSKVMAEMLTEIARLMYSAQRPRAIQPFVLLQHQFVEFHHHQHIEPEFNRLGQNPDFLVEGRRGFQEKRPDSCLECGK